MIVYTYSEVRQEMPERPSTFLFPGGEPHIDMSTFGAVKGKHFALRIVNGSMFEMGNALVASDALRRLGAATVSLLAPYLPGARQDRGEPLTCKVYADLINSAGFDRVVCIDPHSPVMPALLDRLLTLSIADVWKPTFTNTQWRVLCPDAGAVKRTEDFAMTFGYEVVYGHKRRDFATGKLSGFTVPKVVGNLFIVDDICDGGGTFIGLAEVIDKPREELALFTTHGIYSKGTVDLEEYFGNIISTDSYDAVLRPDSEVQRIPVKDIMIDTLRKDLL